MAKISSAFWLEYTVVNKKYSFKTNLYGSLDDYQNTMYFTIDVNKNMIDELPKNLIDSIQNKIWEKVSDIVEYIEKNHLLHMEKIIKTKERYFILNGIHPSIKTFKNTIDLKLKCLVIDYIIFTDDTARIDVVDAGELFNFNPSITDIFEGSTPKGGYADYYCNNPESPYTVVKNIIDNRGNLKNYSQYFNNKTKIEVVKCDDEFLENLASNIKIISEKLSTNFKDTMIQLESVLSTINTKQIVSNNGINISLNVKEEE